MNVNVNVNVNVSNNVNVNISKKTKTKLVEKIYILVNEKSGEHKPPSPMPSKGGYLRKCITFVKDWNWFLIPAIRFVIENCQVVVLIVWALLG